MLRNHFEKIRQYLHLNNRENKFVSIDEGMVKYKGRLGFKQYMPMKPVKRGIKIWVLADATNGCISAMQI